MYVAPHIVANCLYFIIPGMLSIILFAYATDLITYCAGSYDAFSYRIVSKWLPSDLSP